MATPRTPSDVIPPPPWLAYSGAALLRVALGDADYRRRKRGSALRTVAAYARWSIAEARLRRLHAVGLTDGVPTFPQLMVAGQHMMLGAASDETRLFYASQGIGFTFHNLRRFVDFPAAMMDPVGFFADRDAVIHHILTTAHRHPVYDFQLLLMFEDGLAALRAQAEAAAAGTHPDQARLDVLVEDPTYYARLLPQVRAFCDDPRTAAEPLQYPYSDDPYLLLAMDQFKDVPGFVRYACRLRVGRADVWRAVGEEAFKASVGRLFVRRPVALRYDLCDAALIARYFPAGLPPGPATRGG